MISHNQLGRNGRLGNQMFQFAALVGIADKFGYEYCLPPSVLSDEYPDSEFNIFNTFDLPPVRIFITSLNDLNEQKFGYDEYIANGCPDNINLNGFFQSEKYFVSIKEKIKTIFTFKSNIVELANQYFYSTFKNTEVISLHIRRGDYVNYSHHPILSINYYKESLSILPNNIPILIFSDDVDWIKYNNPFYEYNCFISQYNNPIIDLCLQTLCTYHIIANSTFSWWGAWLANSKITISPKLWFAEPLTNDEQYLQCDDWIKI